MKYILIILILFISIGSVFAVSNIEFNYEFNNTKSIVYSNIVKDDSIVLNIKTNINSLYCKYSENAGVYFDSMEGTFDFSFQELHKKSFSYLEEGVYKMYVKCKNGSIMGQESEIIFSIINPVKAKIYLSKESPVSLGLLEITLKTTKQLSQKPILSYSTDGSKYEIIPLTGSNDLWTGYIIIPNTIKESIGSFKFKGIDLDGIIGEEITEGEIFLIDTVNPAQINEIDSEGREKDIYLEWRFNEDFNHFNIYRSKFQNVEYTDYYKQVDKKSFVDNDVEVGRVYYYRITAVDDAGNEGDLSYEVSSIAIKNAVNYSSNDVNTGLDPELIGSVDSLLYDINLFYNQVNDIMSDFESDSDKKEIIDILSLISELDVSEKEIENLEKEVSDYKKQKLTRLELDKKINNARTKLGIIKKKMPESLSVTSQTNFNKRYDETIINEILLSLGKNEDEARDLIKMSKKIMDENNFEYKVEIKNVEIYYADGSKLDKTIFIKDISFDGNNNGSLVEYISNDIAESVSELTFKDNSYSVIKDNTIVSFSSNTKQIIYIIDKEINLDVAKNVETFFLVEEESKDSQNKITGFAIFEEGLNSNSLLYLFAFIIIGFIIYYFFKSKKEKKDFEILNNIGDKLVEAKLYIETKNINKLNEIYNDLNESYKLLSDKNKEEVYNKLVNFNKQIKIIKAKR